MHPVLFEFGPIQVRFYGLMYAIGITCAVFIIRREVLRKQIPFSEDQVVNFVLSCVIGGILGARLYYVGFNWESYRHEAWEILKIWHGGLAIHGGVVGGTLAGWWYVRRHGVRFWTMADITAPCLILAQALGRFGNFMNGDAHGLPTDKPWGIVFPPTSIAGYEFPNTPLHPAMLYELVINAGIFGFLWSIRKRPWKDGFVFCLYCLLYSVGRFFVSGFRADSLMLSLGEFGSFRMARVISVIIILAAGALIVSRQLWKTNDHAGT
jgi:phosphatidylglycerol---prolipoprotein diacylglyceryl transferase